MKRLRNAVIGSLVIAAVLFGAQDLGELKPSSSTGPTTTTRPSGSSWAWSTRRASGSSRPGSTAPGGTVAPDADTVFEIGSITKVFTSLILADMAVRGEVKLDDPVAKFLPPTVKVPERDGRKITLLDLSNQVSGLPRMPDNFKPADMGDPYVDYGPA